MSAAASDLKYFVMLYGNNGIPLPLADLEDDIVLFTSRQEATDAGRNNIIGASFGFEIYEWMER